MIVKFKDAFRVPGFGRKRFPKGVVRDVPEYFRQKGKLPKTAVILPDDHPTEDDTVRAEEALQVADLERAQAEGTDQKALEQAGLAGFEDTHTEVVEASESDVEPKPEPEGPFMFEGQEYKTDAARKAAVTRKENKDANVS